jgi:uncharacterized protein YndB with AHSA1/START domain
VTKGRIHLSATIRAPPETIFRFVTDPRRTPEWDPRVERVTQMTRGALRPGVILRSTLIVDGESFNLDDEVTDYEPPTRFGLRSVLGTTNAVTYTLSEGDANLTHVDVALAYDLPDPPPGASLDEGGLRQAIANALTSSLDLLKDLVEREAAGST